MFELTNEKYRDIRINFQEKDHKYRDNLGNEYVSVTTMLHQYRPVFDKEYWLKKKSEELKTSIPKLARQWDDIKNEACNRGTRVHQNLEDGINEASMFKRAVRYMIRNNGDMITVADIPDINEKVKEFTVEEFQEMTEGKYPQIYDIFRYYSDNGYQIYAEIGAFLPEILLSGTIDVLIIREDGCVIGDWKTNRGGLKFESGYYRKDKTQIPNQLTNEWIAKDERMLPPFTHLPNCNGMIYNLQLSTYMYMVEQILGLPCKGMWLAHIDCDFELNEYGMPKRFADGTYKVKENAKETITMYKMKYLRDEVLKMINDRNKIVDAIKVENRTLFD